MLVIDRAPDAGFKRRALGHAALNFSGFHNSRAYGANGDSARKRYVRGDGSDDTSQAPRSELHANSRRGDRCIGRDRRLAVGAFDATQRP